LAAVIQLVPAAILAPVLGQLGDRFPRQRVLVCGYIAQSVTMGATAAAMIAGLSLPTVFVCAAAAATAETMTRPTMSAILPGLVQSPVELTAANVASEWIVSASYPAAPALGGILLAISWPALVLALCAGLSGAAALAGMAMRSHRTFSSEPRADWLALRWKGSASPRGIPQPAHWSDSAPR
jgi:MFS family permease